MVLAPLVELFPVGGKENKKNRYSNEFVPLKLIAAAAAISLVNTKMFLIVSAYIFSKNQDDWEWYLTHM